ncbi:LacI family DNA-binding transcriptional regulator [Sanguibacter sp. HDW7]|uniref:LacI family DNA-binding transcriptional regulator n=1 Tax=Sanguibacter sp. HDW7 TaxID=2714931 RepID=UPI0014081504|nr:LacI family DNA-binding transcriptional regulator [Sanguibacter sp. HDW7]QIK84588.1 LacI family transcriptional regulator [Sanguibacter sp. HDW7]
MTRVTIKDVAEAAGVSVATVSKVLNERYGVSAATQTRVRAVVESLGYSQSLVASSLRSHRTNVIGILVAEFEPFSTEILKGAASVLADSGYEVLAYTSGRRDAGEGWEQRSLARLSGTLIDGAIIVTPTVVRADASVPIVAIDPHTGPLDLPTVDSDSRAGAALATEHLLALGHRRIAMLTGRADLESSRQREAGYREALGRAGVEVDESLVRVGGYRRESSLAPAHELLTLPERPTAIFAANDLSALGALDVATELGLRVPDDLSIVGFDDVPEASTATPPLTTVRQPIQQMGAAAVALLLRLIEDEDADEDPGTKHVRLDTTLVRRGSTAPPHRP